MQTNCHKIADLENTFHFSPLLQKTIDGVETCRKYPLSSPATGLLNTQPLTFAAMFLESEITNRSLPINKSWGCLSSLCVGVNKEGE